MIVGKDAALDRERALVGDAAARARIIARNGAVLDGECVFVVGDAAAVGSCIVAGNSAVLDRECALVVDVAVFDRTIAGNGAVLDRAYPTVGDAAAWTEAGRRIARNGAVLDNEPAKVVDAAAAL